MSDYDYCLFESDDQSLDPPAHPSILPVPHRQLTSQTNPCFFNVKMGAI